MEQEETINRARDLYAIICNRQLGDDAESVQKRMNAVRWLERATNSDFKYTDDFHRKVSGFLRQTNLTGIDLKRARNSRGWNQEILGCHLGVSRQFIHEMESGAKSLTDKALDFIRKKPVQLGSEDQIG